MSEIYPQIFAELSQMVRPDCPTIKTLGEFLDTGVDAENKTLIEKHLRTCAVCVNRLIELRELARLQTEGPEPSPMLMQDVISIVRAEASSTSTQRQTDYPPPKRRSPKRGK
jgi:hypothetical protein